MLDELELDTLLVLDELLLDDRLLRLLLDDENVEELLTL